MSDFTFTFYFHALEKEMATHSSILAWRIPGMGEPGGLLSLGSHRVGHDLSDLAAAAAVHYKNWINNSYLIYLLLTLVERLRGDYNLNYNVLFLIFKNAKATDKIFSMIKSEK